MAIFRGANAFDFIMRDMPSRGVTSDPTGLRGVAATVANTIHGLAGGLSPLWLNGRKAVTRRDCAKTKRRERQ